MSTNRCFYCDKAVRVRTDTGQLVHEWSFSTACGSGRLTIATLKIVEPTPDPEELPLVDPGDPS